MTKQKYLNKRKTVDTVVVESYRGYNIIACIACGEIQGFYGDSVTEATRFYTPSAITMAEIKTKIDQSWEIRKQNREMEYKVKKAQINKKIPKPQYDFVQQYTLVDPKKLKNGYDKWAGRCFVLVAYEQNKYLITRVKMDTKIVYPFLVALKNAPREISEKPENRTVSVINMKHGARAYVFPNLDETNKNYDIVFSNSKKCRQDLPLSCFISPEINMAIMAQIKIYR